MVGVSLRQKPAHATDQNAHVSIRTAAVRPVSGTPVWARNDHTPHAPGAPRPASPWDAWTIPPKPAALNHTRKPSPHPTGPTKPIEPTGLSKHATRPEHAAHREHSERSEDSAHVELPESFRPWRIDFAHPEVVEYPADIEQAESHTVARRLLLLLGLAYLFLAALASGLAYTGYFATAAGDNNPGSTDNGARNGYNDHGGHGGHDGLSEGDSTTSPGDALPPRPRPPSRDPNAPGLHTRPDGTRYLVMPLPADLTDRFRGRADALQASPAMGGGLL